MKKIRFENLSAIGEILTKEELKHVLGGTGSEEYGSGFEGSADFWWSGGPKVEACRGKQVCNRCSWTTSSGTTYYGKCVWGIFRNFCSADLNC